MPRPPDHYTHAQFEPIDSDFQGETVRCLHCKQWTGSVKTLNRKKDHLLKCNAYLAWRASGNGQDLAPPNRYNKRDSTDLDDEGTYESPYADMNYGQNYTPVMSRNRLPDMTKYFDEFWDDSTGQKVKLTLSFLAKHFSPEQVKADQHLAMIERHCVFLSQRDPRQLLNHYFIYTSPDSLNTDEIKEDLRLYNEQCMRTRCKYCSAVRAKNTTRQFEHLQTCTEFLNSTEGQQAQSDGVLQQTPVDGNPTSSKKDISRGGAPNPNFNFKRQRLSSGRPANTPMRPAQGAQPKQSPSLVNHLLAKNRVSLEDATQQQFLSHAGCGTLSATALGQWLTQQGHMSRALIPFIGNVIGKIRLADKNPQQDTNWRTVDLLVSCINNAKRELEFLRTTQQKYGLQSDSEAPKHATKGFVDLFASASNPGASLLEGMVVLWSIEYLYNVTWQYANTFVQAAPPNPTSYSLPSYLQPGQYDMPNPFGQPRVNGEASNTHNAALREALIPNWTSPGFSKFVDACKAIVDELANAQTTGNGAVELQSCELVFKQVVWLWKQMWPEVTGMGEEDDTAEDGEGSQTNGDGMDADAPIEIQDDNEGGRDDDAPASDSPYGGTGLGAVAAANRVA